MRQINGVYTQCYNRRYAKVRHLFQGRFKAVVVDGEDSFLEVCRYVDFNPVRARMVKQPHDWPWSSCGAHAGRDVAILRAFLEGGHTQTTIAHATGLSA